MVQLGCAVVGSGSVFTVNADLSQSVHELKRKIKEMKPNLVYYDADLLNLYLARDSGKWMHWNDFDIVQMKEGKIPTDIKILLTTAACRLLIPTRNLGKYFGSDFKPGKDEIHLLVKCPDESTVKKRKRFACPLLQLA